MVAHTMTTTNTSWGIYHHGKLANDYDKLLDKYHCWKGQLMSKIHKVANRLLKSKKYKLGQN